MDDTAPRTPSEASEKTAVAAAPHPRENMPAWKWLGTLTIVLTMAMVNGYDVSNVANIQARLYEEFGDIKLVPWIGLSYSLANFAVLGISRKVINCFDIKWVVIVHNIIFMVGAVVAGAANNMTMVIVGRIIMGVGGATVYQCCLTLVTVFATPVESPRLFALVSATWATGLVIGGPIGSAFSANDSTTWRWAFYINLPFVGLATIITFLCVPSKYLGPDLPLLQRLRKIDPLGLALNLITPVLFAIACEFSGAIWPWSSASTIAIWIITALATLSWALQQALCIFTTKEERAVPLHLLVRTDLLPLWIAGGCAGAAYAITLYYTPLYLSFARGHDALQQTVRLLPFIIVFIVVVIIVGGALPVIGRYAIIYLIAGAAILSGSAAMANTLSDPTVSESTIMGLIALIGIGLGCSFQHGVGISNVINKDAQDKVDSTILFNMAQMGSIAISLSIAGAVFQNVGFAFINEAIGDRGYSEEELRQALAGVSSVVWQSRDEEVLERGVLAVSRVIAREFYLVVVAGAVCLVCAVVMKWEKLDYGKGSGRGDAEEGNLKAVGGLEEGTEQDRKDDRVLICDGC
ncbi:major facilitator superfamily domain-containing protein [Aspergillus karnatakaensis]|uniref:major facilitator superfamily domain-containing protein n=1 Tax=Aspergillus karnatakaensis TaxID=1810916 RepID=UPI003CCCF1A3